MSLPAKPNRRQRAAAFLRGLLAALASRAAPSASAEGERPEPKRRRSKFRRRKGG